MPAVPPRTPRRPGSAVGGCARDRNGHVRIGSPVGRTGTRPLGGARRRLRADAWRPSVGARAAKAQRRVPRDRHDTGSAPRDLPRTGAASGSRTCVSARLAGLAARSRRASASSIARPTPAPSGCEGWVGRPNDPRGAEARCHEPQPIDLSCRRASSWDTPAEAFHASGGLQVTIRTRSVLALFVVGLVGSGLFAPAQAAVPSKRSSSPVAPHRRSALADNDGNRIADGLDRRLSAGDASHRVVVTFADRGRWPRPVAPSAQATSPRPSR